MAHLSTFPLSLLQISPAFRNFSISLILFLCTFTGSICLSIHHNGRQSSVTLSLPQSVWRTHSSYHLYRRMIHIYIPQAKSPKGSMSTGSPTTLQLSTSNIETCLCPQTSPLPSIGLSVPAASVHEDLPIKLDSATAQIHRTVSSLDLPDCFLHLSPFLHPPSLPHPFSALAGLGLFHDHHVRASFLL